MKSLLALLKRLFGSVFGRTSPAKQPYRHYSAILGSDQP